MRIELKKSDILGLGAIAGLAYLAYKAVKSGTERRKLLKEHKAEMLKNRDLEREITGASIKNDFLSTEYKADAKRVLCHMKKNIIAANTIENFDDALEQYDNFVDILLSSPADVSTAEIIYQKYKIDEETRIAEMEKQLASERRNCMDISDAIRAINKSYCDKNDNILSVSIG